MYNKPFEIYDGRRAFYQWDTNQKLIVNDNNISEVRFGNSSEVVSKRRIVYQDSDEVLVCEVPNSLLEKSKNLVVYGCTVTKHGEKTSSSTICSMKFAVAKQEMPEGHISSDESELDNIHAELAELAKQIKDVNKKIEMKKFNSKEDAESWANLNKTSGIIVLVDVSSQWVAHIINNDYSVVPICNSDNEMITIDINGGNSFGVYSEN